MTQKLKLYTYSTLLLNIWSLEDAHASAWMLNKGEYKYQFSYYNIDKLSVEFRARRIDSYVKYEKIKTLMLMKIMRQKYSKDSLINLKNKIYIKNLNKILNTLASYQNDFFITRSVEYGINNEHNIGVELSHQYNQFIQRNNTTKLDLFYKKLLLANTTTNTQKIISVQPKFSTSTNNLYGTENTYGISLLFGRSKKYNLFESFTNIETTISTSSGKYKDALFAMSFATSHGINFNNNIMITYYNKNTHTPNQKGIYNKTLYQQLSIAKWFTSKRCNKQKLTIQAGYFWEQSLILKQYKISGPIFTAWINL